MVMRVMSDDLDVLKIHAAMSHQESEHQHQESAFVLGNPRL